MTADRSFHIPEDRHYQREHHLWAKHDADTGNVRVGIDAIGLESLGELAYVALKDVGTQVARGESIGTLEAAKMTTNIVAPISGTITGRNDAVLENPLIVNTDSYDRGWLVEIEATDWDADAATLVSGAAIPEWVAAAAARFESEAGAD
jgi:glycine cleavage system H protein